MKKIAIVSKKYGNGGVEKVLIDLLENVDYSKYSVDLIQPTSSYGIYPAEVNLIEMEAILSSRSVKYAFIHPFQSIVAAIVCGKNYIFRKRPYVDQLRDNVYSLQRIDKTYDVAIAYDGPLGFSLYYTLHNIKSKSKIFWVHGSVKGDNISPDIIRNYYSRYDKMIFVSRSIMEEFSELYPEIENVGYHYNFFNADRIQEKAKDSITDFKRKKGNYVIVTVARLSREKGIDIAIEAAVLLKEKGINFQWVIIGDGAELKNLNETVNNKGLTENVVLLGEKSNPYPYMHLCDLYVQPSRTEGFCTTTVEAKILHKPIIVTDVGGMREQFTDGDNAIIVPKENPKMLAEAINAMILKPLYNENYSKNEYLWRNDAHLEKVFGD